MNQIICGRADILARVEREAQRSKLLFLPLLKRTSDFAAFAMMNAPAKAVTQFRMVELGQDAPAERRVVDIAQNYVEYGPQEKKPNLRRELRIPALVHLQTKSLK